MTTCSAPALHEQGSSAESRDMHGERFPKAENRALRQNSEYSQKIIRICHQKPHMQGFFFHLLEPETQNLEQLLSKSKSSFQPLYSDAISSVNLRARSPHRQIINISSPSLAKTKTALRRGIELTHQNIPGPIPTTNHSYVQILDFQLVHLIHCPA